MALLGENGAGKSTLIKTLTGVYHADRGAIWLEGNAISPKTPRMRSNWGSARSTRSEPAAKHVGSGQPVYWPRAQTFWPAAPQRDGSARREADGIVWLSLDVREPLNRFSVAMQQIVAICRAIDLSAKVLILDEPTASLDTREVEMLLP